MQYGQDNQEALHKLKCGLKGSTERRGLINLSNVELGRQMIKEQPTRHQETMKFTNNQGSPTLQRTYPNALGRK